MKAANYRGILYFIITTIVITIGVQVYWNYNNYQLNRQRVNNEIQLSLDNAIEEYYAEIAKTDFLTIIHTDTIDTNFTTLKTEWKSNSPKFIYNSTNSGDEMSSLQLIRNGNDSTHIESVISSVQDDLQLHFPQDSMVKHEKIAGFTQWDNEGSGLTFDRKKGISKVQIIKGKFAQDSIKLLKHLRPILISMQRDSLDYFKMDSLVRRQLKQKDINLTYVINHVLNEKTIYTSASETPIKNSLYVNAKSTFLKPLETINLSYESPFFVALKRSYMGIFISFLLALAIISCLVYLLKIIQQQKQLAEIKNDLISNITHEFKTPIATIGVALESIKDFKVLDDKEKTQSYLKISTGQLTKLNTMVEKLLETATLDSEALVLHREETNLYELLEDLIAKHRLQLDDKVIRFESAVLTTLTSIDPFHMENAINNLIDNAIKYGGDKIRVSLIESKGQTMITISDNGNSLTPAYKAQIFEKFFRVPRGNQHDVKGFGIGLYYAKKIVEKHDGTLELTLKNKSTDFIITLNHHG